MYDKVAVDVCIYLWSSRTC